MFKNIGIIHDDLHPLLDKIKERLESKDCKVSMIYWKDIKKNIENKENILSEFDIIYLDRMGELFSSYSTQLLLLLSEIEKLPNIRIVNNPKPYLFARDKALMSIKMKEANLPIPNTLIAYTTEQIDDYCSSSSSDYFIAKSYLGCCAQDIFTFKKCKYPEGVNKILDRDGIIIVQDFILNPDRYIWRIDVVDSKVVQCNQRFAFNESLETPLCNGTIGGDIIFWEPNNLPKDIYNLAVKAINSLDLEVAGVDILVSKNKELFIAEVNPEPDITLNKLELPYAIADYLISVKQSKNKVIL